MNINQIIFFVLIFQAFLCSSQNIKQFDQNITIENNDTLVSKILLFENEDPETEYFVVTKTDTSDFIVVFSQDENNGKIDIIVQYDLLYKNGKLYKSKIKEFEKILNYAKNDFNYDSLSTLVLGRLITTGDLAIDITKEFIHKYGNKFENTDYKYVPDFLLESKLAKDINKLFEPYSIQVSDIIIEKLGFIPSEFISSSSIIETPKNKIPEKIIDCMIWIELIKK